MATKYEKKSREAFEYPIHSDRTKYKSRCVKCGRKFTLLTQEDDCPEYYTNVAVVCECGGIAYFQLPVN